MAGSSLSMTSRADAVVGIVLAAGAARRYGGTKQLAVLDGAPLVTHAVTLLRRAGIGRVIVVTGHDAEAVERAVQPGAICVRNSEYLAGQSTTLAAGLLAAEQLEPAVEVALVVLGDQPRMPAEVARQVLAVARGSDRPARARYIDAVGPPVALPRACWPEVREHLRGDAGAGRFLGRLGAVHVDVDLPMPRDVDRPSDLRTLRELAAGDPSPAPTDPRAGRP